jgi:hypothetical protein
MKLWLQVQAVFRLWVTLSWEGFLCAHSATWDRSTYSKLFQFDLGMVGYAVEQFIFVVKTFILKRKCHRLCLHKFQQQYQGAMQPSENRVLELFEWQETSSILNERKWWPKCAFTEQRLDIWVRMEMRPRKSSDRLGRECCVSECSILRGLRCPRFILAVSVVYNLFSADLLYT